jgi:ZipA-like protein with FtsZ-binding domain
MSDLQLALIAGGVVVVAAVAVYNVVQERKARKRAESAFGEQPPDALLGGAPAAERREPTLGDVPPPSDIVEAAEEIATLEPAAPPAESTPQAQVSSHVDTVAVILAEEPVTSEQLAPLHAVLEGFEPYTHVEGIVDEQWQPVETSTARSWRELRVGLQLANRKGPVSEDEIERFNRAIADFAAAVNAVSQREAPATAAERAREIDRFCADTDIEIAVNVVGQYGATFAIPRVKSLGLENGLSETVSGELVRYAPDGGPGFVVRRFDISPKPSPTYYTGLTFALDVPQVANAPRVLDEMIRLAAVFAATLGGELVDDNRKPLTDAGLASIRRTLEGVVRDMQARGIACGGPLARRLFS